MFIGINTGNTRTFIGLYSEESSTPFEIIPIGTDRALLKSHLEKSSSKVISEFSHRYGKVTGAAFSSVVPELNRDLLDFFSEIYNVGALEISRKCNLNIGIRYDDPDQLGVDRIVNAEAALIQYGEDTLVVDLGTAVTFCVINGRVFEGGLIAPGIGISKRALHGGTSRLPDVDFRKPEYLVARNTEDAIRAGLYYGWASMIEGIVKRIKSSYNKDFKLIITGGNALEVSGEITVEYIIDVNLTMKGIKYIYEQNRI